MQIDHVDGLHSSQQLTVFTIKSTPVYCSTGSPNLIVWKNSSWEFPKVPLDLMSDLHVILETWWYIYVTQNVLYHRFRSTLDQVMFGSLALSHIMWIKAERPTKHTITICVALVTTYDDYEQQVEVNLKSKLLVCYCYMGAWILVIICLDNGLISLWWKFCYYQGQLFSTTFLE